MGESRSRVQQQSPILGADLMWAFVGYSALVFLFFAGLALAALTYMDHQKHERGGS